MKIGIDIGGSHIGIGLLDNENLLIKKKERDIEEIGRAESAILEYIDENIEDLKEHYHIDLIGIATPGNTKGKCMKNLVNLNIPKLDFTNLMEKNKEIIFQIKNDAKAAGIAEMKYGALKDYNDAVFLCLGTGIGSAVFMDNELLKSNRNTGFELGHMIIDKNGLKCSCGKRGCFETYCSMKRFKENICNIFNFDNLSSEELKDILEEIFFIKKENGKVCIFNEETKLDEEEYLKGKIIIHKDDMIKAREIIEQYIKDLIVGISNIIDIFEPQAICLGGGFVHFKNIFYDKLVQEMNRKRYVFNKDEIPDIVLAELKNDAGVIGSVM